MWECGFLNWIAHRNSLVTQRKPRNTSLSGTKAFNTQVIVMREEFVQHWQHQVTEQKGSQHTGQVISTKKAEPINYS
jgi:flagellar biosynthesis protein FliP